MSGLRSPAHHVTVSVCHHSRLRSRSTAHMRVRGNEGRELGGGGSAWEGKDEGQAFTGSAIFYSPKSDEKFPPSFYLTAVPPSLTQGPAGGTPFPQQVKHCCATESLACDLVIEDSV